eukprot:3562151-Rhodomonas_salina.1
MEMTARMTALVETMKKEMDRQAQAMTALAATVAKLSGQPPPSRRSEQPDVEEVYPPPDSTAENGRPAKTSRGDGMAGVADAFVRALEERLGTGSSSAGDEQVTDTHALRQIARTHPAL